MLCDQSLPLFKTKNTPLLSCACARIHVVFDGVPRSARVYLAPLLCSSEGQKIIGTSPESYAHQTKKNRLPSTANALPCASAARLCNCLPCFARIYKSGTPLSSSCMRCRRASWRSCKQNHNFKPTNLQCAPLERGTGLAMRPGSDRETVQHNLVYGEVLALRAYCAHRGWDTHPRIPLICLVARRSSKAHMRTTKLPSTW